MVLTRSTKTVINMDNINEVITNVIDTKLSELRDTLVKEIKVSIDDYISEKKSELLLFFEEEKAKMLQEISDIRDSHHEIQQHVTSLKAKNIEIESKLEDQQQYGRRQNVRIFGIPVKKDESLIDVEKSVKNLLTKYGIPLGSLDRCHRIGKKKFGRITTQPIIARFSTFRDRTLFYKKRKELKEKDKIGVSIDLTTERLSLLRKAREHIKEKVCVKFAYADTNCNLRIFTDSGKHIGFKTMAELTNIVAKLDQEKQS